MSVRTRKLVCLVIAVLMAVAVMPLASFAKSAYEAAKENKKLALLDDVWAGIETVEADMLAKRAGVSAVTMAAYNAAVNDPRVDKGSIVWENEGQFAFTVDGMHNLY